MGRYQVGANGAFSGKVGSVIGSNWRNIDYLRGFSKRKYKSSSEKQVAQRAKFALAPNYLRPIKSILNLGLGDKKLRNSSGYNMAVKQFLNEVITGDYPDFTMDFSLLIISKGSLLNLELLTVSINGSNIQLNWKNNPNSKNANADDLATIILYNETRNSYSVYESAKREDAQLSIETDPAYAGDDVHVWGFAVTRDAAEVSNSMYLGMVQMP